MVILCSDPTASAPPLPCPSELRACKEITYAFWTSIHPGCLRCSAGKYSPVFSLLAPWQPGASTTVSAQVIPSQTLRRGNPCSVQPGEVRSRILTGSSDPQQGGYQSLPGAVKCPTLKDRDGARRGVARQLVLGAAGRLFEERERSRYAILKQPPETPQVSAWI